MERMTVLEQTPWQSGRCQPSDDVGGFRETKVVSTYVFPTYKPPSLDVGSLTMIACVHERTANIHEADEEYAFVGFRSRILCPAGCVG